MIFTYEQISKLNDTELIVYNYIVKNVGLVLKMNIRELAAQSHVSTATITRFCHKLDCDGFVELAHKQHVDMLCFLANKNSKTYQYATLPIIVGTYNPFSHDNLVPNTFFGQVLITFESLLYSYLSPKK